MSIVEQGSNGNWRYWKFNSGLAICYFSGNVNVEISQTLGSFYYGDYLSEYPLTFTTYPAVSTTSAWGGLVSFSNNSDSKTTMEIRFIATYNIGAATPVLGAVAIGMWK